MVLGMLKYKDILGPSEKLIELGIALYHQLGHNQLTISNHKIEDFFWLTLMVQFKGKR